jgi:hypothetical protein
LWTTEFPDNTSNSHILQEVVSPHFSAWIAKQDIVNSFKRTVTLGDWMPTIKLTGLEVLGIVEGTEPIRPSKWSNFRNWRPSVLVSPESNLFSWNKDW